MDKKIWGSLLGICICWSNYVNAGEIPFPEALEQAKISLSSVQDGQREGVLLGNGDLYGIVFGKKDNLLIRITKNDIWDARVDTSKDPPLPKIDFSSNKIAGHFGNPPSYNLPYPHPRCAVALRLSPKNHSLDYQWQCVRKASRNDLKVRDNKGTAATMEMAGKKGESTGYSLHLPKPVTASSFEMTISGNKNALYYIEIPKEKGQSLYASGWQVSPITEKTIKVSFPSQPIKEIILYTMSKAGGKAQNHFKDLTLNTSESPLQLRFNSPNPQKAELNIRKAVAFFPRGKSEGSQIRILHDRNVVLIQSPLEVNIEPITAPTLPQPKLGTEENLKWMVMDMPGDQDYKGMKYAVVSGSRGNLKAISLVTSFDIESDKVLLPAIKLVQETLNEEENKLIANHEKAWANSWSRSGVKLDDPAFQRWWYRVLYYARTVCKPGTAPINLMPPLATDNTPWHSDYHHNYNSWQAFYFLPGCNLPELADPWISYIHSMLPRFKYLAKETCGIDGVIFPISSFLHEPDPALCSSVNKRQLSFNPWGMTIGMVGMTIQNLWQKQLCQPDNVYLEAKIYPTLREGAKFFLGFMKKCSRDKNGKVLLGPSYSPEHGNPGVCNCPYDIAYAHYTFDAFCKASKILGRDSDLAKECSKFDTLLPNYPTTIRNGKKIVVDWQNGPHISIHNITVPATPVFPCNQVTWFSPEPVKELFKDTIQQTRFNGNNSHVMFNIAKARLSMPEAVENSKKWFLSRELPNGLFVWQGHQHGTYMGEMNGIPGMINEFLIQSVQGKIRLFPCWPKDKDASFSNLRCENGFLVSAEQKQGKITRLEITSTVGGKLCLLSPWKTISLNGKTLKQNEQGLISVMTQAGEKLTFSK